MTTVQWVAADGTTITLNAEWGASNLFAPPVKLDEYSIPGQPGGVVREARHDVREFIVPIWLYDPDDGQQWTDMRELTELMDPTKGTGRIRVITPVGDQREIYCIATAGLGMNTSDSTPNAQKAGIVFRAHDPYWHGNPVVDEYTVGGETVTFFPFFPLVLSGSEVFASVTLDNPGSVVAWPIWEIEGPGADLTVRSLTTGEFMTINVTLALGESVTIDTRPGHKSITHSDGSNLFSSLSLDSAFWALQPGSNSISLEMGAADANSLVRLQYTPRFLTA